MTSINTLLKILFGHKNYFSVQIRMYYTFFFILYILHLIPKNIFFTISKLLYMPLIVSIIGYFIVSACFIYKGQNITKVFHMVRLQFNNNYNITHKNLDFFVYLYDVLFKFIVLYLIVKHINPKISYETIFGSIYLILYFYYFPLDETYLGQNMKFNSIEFAIILIISSTIMQYIIYNYFS